MCAVIKTHEMTMNIFSEQRNAERFAIAYEVQLEDGNGVTRDLSSTGVYFTTSNYLEVGYVLQFYILLQKIGKSINRLRCEGQVIRTDESSQEWGIAVHLLTFGFEYSHG